MTHNYQTTLTWEGNRGSGTSGYKSYDRDYSVEIDGKPTVKGSADPSFRGDPGKHNPEELFLASLSACHMLWYLHLCADHGITVVEYTDAATGEMKTEQNGSGRFTSVTLHPTVLIKKANNLKLAKEFHHKANEMCFIANSCNFPVLHEVTILAQKGM